MLLLLFIIIFPSLHGVNDDALGWLETTATITVEMNNCKNELRRIITYLCLRSLRHAILSYFLFHFLAEIFAIAFLWK